MKMNILILVFSWRLSMGMKIDREVSDTLHGWTHCASTGRAEGVFSCTCKPEYKTFMSSEGDEYTCKSLSEVGCEYSLQDNDQALLVTEKNLVRPIFSKNGTKNNLTMEKVLVWNYDGYQGSWNDITRETERLFKLDEISGNSTLHISNLTLKAMAGHAVRITFKDTKCVVFKFKGTVEYGFDLGEFKKKFGVKPTSAPVTTTAAKPATTERKSTVEKVTTTSKPKITTSPVTKTTKITKTTTIKPTTKSTTLKPKTTTNIPTTQRTSTTKQRTDASTKPSTLKPKITTITPTKNGTQSELVGNHVKSNIIYTVVSIVIVMSFGFAVFFVYRRRRKQNMNRELNQRQEMSSNVNNSYEPDTCKDTWKARENTTLD